MPVVWPPRQTLRRYGFGRARAYLLLYGGRPYDSKAILGVAYLYAIGIALGAHDFNGGKFGGGSASFHELRGGRRLIARECLRARVQRSGRVGSRGRPQAE
jgi:hypothetical protein